MHGASWRKALLQKISLVSVSGNSQEMETAITVKSLHQLTSVTYDTAIGNIHSDFTNVEIAFVTECISKC